MGTLGETLVAPAFTTPSTSLAVECPKNSSILLER